MSTDILALINALIDNERVYDTFEMQLYEGTGTVPAGYTEYVTRFNQLVRAQYADPLSAGLSFSVSLHWDATNGVRNDRFDGGLL